MQATIQPSVLSEVTAHLLAAQLSTAAAQQRSTAASPACEECPADVCPDAPSTPDEPTPRQPRSKRVKRETVAPLVEVLLTLDPSSVPSPPPVVINGARLAPHIACKAQHALGTTHLRHGCSSLQRTDLSSSDSKRPSARLANTPMPAAAACDRARDFCPGEPSPNTLSRACRFLLQQDDVPARCASTVHSSVVTVVSDMRHQHRHDVVDGEPVPMQFIERVLQECTTWMAP